MNVLGIPMVIRIHGRDTGGVVSSVESHDVPGGGPPPHIHHREDEIFQILEGEYECTVGGKTFTAQKGATIFAPRGVPHTYRYLGQTPGRLMCVITPAGFEGFFEEIGAMTPLQQQDSTRAGNRKKIRPGVSAPGWNVTSRGGVISGDGGGLAVRKAQFAIREFEATSICKVSSLSGSQLPPHPASASMGP